MRRMSSKVLLASCSLLLTVLVVPHAAAQAPLLDGFGGTRGFGSDCLYYNDDGSSREISLSTAFPHGLRFFTRTHHSVYVNTNGNLTFSAPLAAYTPQAFPVADEPMIAPYWADVDIREDTANCGGIPDAFYDVSNRACHNPSDNGVWWHIEPGLMVVTWDQVGYYKCNLDKRMSFQLILTESYNPCGGEGDFDVEFRFNRCDWNTGDASGGEGGLWPPGRQVTNYHAPAQAGFDAGDLQNYVEVPGSRTGNIHNIMCNQSNVGEPGVWRYQIRGGVIGGCEGAGEPCDTGDPGICAYGVKQCAGAATICVPLFEPRDEECNGLDDNCNGIVDDGEDLCGGYEICHRGTCVPPCAEFGCLGDQVCGPEGVCVDPECVDVRCGEGKRCVEGVCVEPCDGVICPHGQDCHAGRCLDACDIIECDECTVCIDGTCEIMCQYQECPPGYTCLDDGRCVEDACATTTCQEGFYCSGGTCVDACDGASCPHGEVCRAGQCVPGTDPGGGNGNGNGNGNGSNGGGPTGENGNGNDGGVTGGGGGCDCGVGLGASGAAGTLLLLLGLSLVLRRGASRREAG